MAAGSPADDVEQSAHEAVGVTPAGLQFGLAVTVQHGGLESDPGSWFGHIVPGTGTGGFTGWSGSARIVHDDQGAYFEIKLS